MNETSKHILKFMHDKLYSELKKNNKLKRNSVLISLLEMKSNKRFEILIKASVIDGEGIGKYVSNELIKEGYVIKIGESKPIKYILSGKGIWYVEKDVVEFGEIISYLDNKFFGEYRKEPKLTNREKVIILTLIALGAFSKKQAIDLKSENVSKDKIKDVLNKSLAFLKQHGIVGENFSENALYGKLGNEHPVSHLIRHTDKLPKKTYGIYKVENPQRYYLNLYHPENDFFDADGLAYLYTLIFKNKLESIKGDVLKFVEKIYNKYTIYIFPERLISPQNLKEYIEDAFHKYMLNI